VTDGAIRRHPACLSAAAAQWLGAALGVMLGCILGIIPLLFMDKAFDPDRKEGEGAGAAEAQQQQQVAAA
jgi:hypothetical protein